MRVPRALVVLVLSLVVAACGEPAMGPQASSSSPSPSVAATPTTIEPAGTATASPASTTTPPTDQTPTQKPTVSGSTTLTEEDAGTTVKLRVGESVRVVLPAEYHRPDANGAAVERTAAAGGYPSGTSATATFVAVGPGTADVSSTTDYACLHATPSCSLPQRLWSVTIVVS